MKSHLESIYKLEDVQHLLDAGWEFHIGGDKGYIHLQPPSPEGFDWNVIITKSGEKELRRGSPQKDGDNTKKCRATFTTDLCVPRAVIERRIGAMKR